MTKSDRHKKNRKKEKGKTKLTGVKRLGKSQNVIQPTFRAKKIQLRQQLQLPAEGDVVQTTRNRTLKDLLQSLNHHNVNIKKDALHGLHEIISSQPDALYSNLDKILEKIGSLTSDLEGSIRRENVQLAEFIFAQLNEEQMKPFWNLLMTYVKCTLTHLNATIRHSCLPFATLLISYFPNLVSTSLKTLLPNVLGLISSLRATGSVLTGAPQKPGTLSKKKKLLEQAQLRMDLSLKQETFKERVNVLQFLATCLDTYTKSSGTVNQSNENAAGREKRKSIPTKPYIGLYYPFGYQETNGESYYFGDEGSSKVGEKLGYIFKPPPFRPISFPILLEGLGGDGNDATNVDFWAGFIESCLPVLNQVWLEVRPDEDQRNNTQVNVGKIQEGDQFRGQCNLASNVIEVLDSIVSIMTSLLLNNKNNTEFNSLMIGSTNTLSSGQMSAESNQSNFFRLLRKTYGQDLKKYFFQWIPFSTIQTDQKKTLSQLNLQLFQLAAELRLMDSEIMGKLDVYLHVLMRKSALDSIQISIVLQILPLLRFSKTESLINEIIIYGINSGYYETVNKFLLNSFSIGKRKEGRRSGSETESTGFLNWEVIVTSMLHNIPSCNSLLLEVLRGIGLRRLLDLKSFLKSYAGNLRDYLILDKMEVEKWDEVIGVLHYSDSLDLVITSNYFGLSPSLIPLEIIETVNSLLGKTNPALHTKNVTRRPSSEQADLNMEIENFISLEGGEAEHPLK